MNRILPQEWAKIWAGFSIQQITSIVNIIHKLQKEDEKRMINKKQNEEAESVCIKSAGAELKACMTESGERRGKVRKTKIPGKY